MLVISRRELEGFRIGPDIRIVIVKAGARRVHVGVVAPPGIKVLRDELVNQDENDLDQWATDGGK